jgi:hypothetical protein
VTPAAISLLLVHLKKGGFKRPPARTTRPPEAAADSTPVEPDQYQGIRMSNTATCST